MNYEYIGWCNEDNHDKVWGIIRLKEIEFSNHPNLTWYKEYKYVTFWGRRGAKLQTKFFQGSDQDAWQMFNKKLKKGYQEVDKNQLNKVYPEFESDLEKTAVWAMLSV